MANRTLKSSKTSKSSKILKSSKTLKRDKKHKKQRTLKKKDNIQDKCHILLRLILITPHSHIGSEEAKIELIRRNFSKRQVLDVLNSKMVIIRPIQNYHDYGDFIKYAMHSIRLNRSLPLFE